MRAARAAGGALVTLALAAALLLRPGDRSLALDAWLLALGALALSAFVRLAREALPGRASELERALRPRPGAPEELPELARVERELALATSTAFDLHYRLRPTLRAIAAHRLASRRGLELDRGGKEVERLLGRIGWEICRPDRERPSDHFGPAPRLDQVREVLDALEAL